MLYLPLYPVKKQGAAEDRWPQFYLTVKNLHCPNTFVCFEMFVEALQEILEAQARLMSILSKVAWFPYPDFLGIA